MSTPKTLEPPGSKLAEINVLAGFATGRLGDYFDACSASWFYFAGHATHFEALRWLHEHDSVRCATVLRVGDRIVDVDTARAEQRCGHLAVVRTEVVGLEDALREVGALIPSAARGAFTRLLADAVPGHAGLLWFLEELHHARGVMAACARVHNALGNDVPLAALRADLEVVASALERIARADEAENRPGIAA